MVEINLEEVLEWVNSTRKTHNIGEPLSELPKGKPKALLACPIARALTSKRVKASTSKWNTVLTTPYLFGPPTHIEHPGLVVNFIIRFDLGKYPDLTEPATHA